jgi:thioredoxin reductase (NADPH)
VPGASRCRRRRRYPIVPFEEASTLGKPLIHLVDDNAGRLVAFTGALRRRFGGDYEVVGEPSAGAALAALGGLAAGTEVAILVAATRMAEMDGTEYLVRAHELHPAAKRVLLVGRGQWASAHPMVRALALAQVDYYLFHPWGEPERWLHLPVSQFLADWSASRATGFEEEIRIVGERWAARSHELRDLLARVALPHGFYQPDSEAGRALLEQAGQDGTILPVLVFRSGLALADPSDAQIAETLGFHSRAQGSAYDVAVVGGGPAGLAVAVYAASEGLRTVIVEPTIFGGQAGTSSMIRNYLGFPYGVSGDDLANRAMEQAWLFGAEFVLSQRATSLTVDGDQRRLGLSDGGEVTARTVVVASGVAWRRLGVPSLEALQGAGVFYGAAASEARAMEGQDVYVVGGGNSAGQAAVHLAKWAASVTLLVRGGGLAATMSDYLVKEVEALPNVAVRPRTQVVAGHGHGRLEALTLADDRDGTTRTVPATALFVMIGAEPRTEWLAGVVERDPGGYVLTGHDLLRGGTPPPTWPLARPPLLFETSVPGVFAAGDVRHRSVKRVASAVGAGAIVVQLVHEYLAGQRG